MNSKDIKPWQKRIDLANTTAADKREAMFAEISELRQALAAAEARVAALNFFQGQGLTDCDMHDDESN